MITKSITNETELGYHSIIGTTTTEKGIEWNFKPYYEKNKVAGAIVTAKPCIKDLEKERLDLYLDTISEISKVGLWEYDIEEDNIHWSQTTKSIYEVPEDYQPNLNKVLEFCTIAHSRNKISMLIHNAIEIDNKFQERIQITTHKGNEIFVLFSGKSIYKGDKVVKLVGTIQNISGQVITENRLRENEKLLFTLIDNIPLNVYLKDKESKNILVNKSSADYLNVKHPNELIGKNNSEYFDTRTEKLLRKQDVQVLKTQKPIIAQEEIITKKDGTSIPFLISKVPLKDVKGKTYAILGISINISNLKQKEIELTQLIDITSIQNKKLTNFAHIVSHDLRSHSANFSMLLSFLTKEKDEKEKEKIMEMLLTSSDGLLNALDNLNQIVDIHKNTNLAKTDINLCTSIDTIHKSLYALFKKNKVVFKKHLGKCKNINGIPSYVDSIIHNLLTNAVKYKHPDRNPIISVNTKKEGNKIVLSVKDNGIGIDLRKNGDKLFGMYKTFHANDDARGIGLYITKNQIEAMGGNILVYSEVDKGTTFKVYFNEKY